MGLETLLLKKLSKTADSLGLDFHDPQVIADRMRRDLGYSEGTLYAWLSKADALEYLKENYGETIKMDLEGRTPSGKSDL